MSRTMCQDAGAPHTWLGWAAGVAEGVLRVTGDALPTAGAAGRGACAASALRTSAFPLIVCNATSSSLKAGNLHVASLLLHSPGTVLVQDTVQLHLLSVKSARCHFRVILPWKSLCHLAESLRNAVSLHSWCVVDERDGSRVMSLRNAGPAAVCLDILTKHGRGCLI